MSNDQPDLFESTVGRATTGRFRRERSAQRWVGVLTPIAGLATTTLRLDQDETIVGREKDPGAPGYDESVSRWHARPLALPAAAPR
jgi:hypothetical protein